MQTKGAGKTALFFNLSYFMLVVIPYYAPGSQGRELEMAIAGWRKHCKSDYHIVVVGETDPNIIANDVSFVYSKRVDDIEGSYRPHLDYVSCLRKVHEVYPEERGMVFAADDNYAVNDFDETWIRKLHYLTDVPFEGAVDGWPIEKFFTRCKLEDLGLPTRNWTTHMPCWFDFDKLMDMFDRYEMDKQSFVLEDMYFNTYHAGDEAELDAPYKFFLSKPEDVVDIEAAMRQRIWICNTVDGWSRELENKLLSYYKL